MTEPTPGDELADAIRDYNLAHHMHRQALVEVRNAAVAKGRAARRIVALCATQHEAATLLGVDDAVISRAIRRANQSEEVTDAGA